MFNEILNLCTRVVIAVEKLADAAQHVVKAPPMTIGDAAAAQTVTPQPVTENPTATPKQTRAKKTTTPASDPAPITTANVPPVATNATAAETAELPTRDEIRALLAQVMTKKGKEVAGKIITEIGNSTNITKIVDENLQAVFDACQKELA